MNNHPSLENRVWYYSKLCSPYLFTHSFIPNEDGTINNCKCGISFLDAIKKSVKEQCSKYRMKDKEKEFYKEGEVPFSSYLAQMGTISNDKD